MRSLLFRRSAPPDPPAAEPDHILLRHAGADYRVRIQRRAAARRITLRISRATGEAVLTLPERTSLQRARQFAETYSGWVATHLARVPARVPFTPGALVPLRGEAHRIVHMAGTRAAVAVARDPAGAPVINVGGDEAHVPRRVRDFLVREAEHDLREAVARYTQSLDRKASAITIRDTTSRWGSCSAAGRLNFSWRLILAPPDVLDYLAAHEVAHLKEMNHSPRFWRLVHGLCPHTEAAEAWLKRHGSGLHRYG